MEEIKNTTELNTTPTVIDTINEVDIIDTLQMDAVITAEKLGKPIRDSRGRFVIGNRESVGNKGGRPKDITLADLQTDETLFDRLMCDFVERGDERASKALLKFFDGKLK